MTTLAITHFSLFLPESAIKIRRHRTRLVGGSVPSRRGTRWNDCRKKWGAPQGRCARGRNLQSLSMVGGEVFFLNWSGCMFFLQCRITGGMINICGGGDEDGAGECSRGTLVNCVPEGALNCGRDNFLIFDS